MPYVLNIKQVNNDVVTDLKRAPKILLAKMKAHWDESGGRILLGGNTCGEVVTLRPIMFQVSWSLEFNGTSFIVIITNLYGLNCPGMKSGGGQIFRTRPDRPWGPSHTMGTGSFPVVKQPRRDVDHPPHLVPWLKKEYSYTPAHSLGLHESVKDQGYAGCIFWLERHYPSWICTKWSDGKQRVVPGSFSAFEGCYAEE